MVTIEVQVSDDLARLIDRQVSAGQAASPADFLAESAALYAHYLSVEDEFVEMAARADSDMAAGRYVTVATPEDSLAMHQAMIADLRAALDTEQETAV
jgi:hypothetical protein